METGNAQWVSCYGTACLPSNNRLLCGQVHEQLSSESFVGCVLKKEKGVSLKPGQATANEVIAISNTRKFSSRATEDLHLWIGSQKTYRITITSDVIICDNNRNNKSDALSDTLLQKPLLKISSSTEEQTIHRCT